jgi:CelD/BcsL family acetyltransferase involved in cellulose biosynthesis
VTGLLEDAIGGLLERRQYECAVTSTFAGLRTILDDWNRLFITSETTNGFAHPEWLMAWAEQYVDDGDLCVVTVRVGGEIVGLAPFHRLRRPALPPQARLVPGARVLRLLGTGHGTEITELPEILTRDAHSRTILRAIVRGLLDLVEDWDWADLTLTPEQGWFDSEWIAPAGQRTKAFALHKATRACVVAPLASSWDEYRLALRRNVRESIRRGENRLRRAGHEWRLVDDFPNDAAVEDALQHLTVLHNARAALRRGPCHSSHLENADARGFLQDAVVRLAATGNATPALLEVDGQVVAARLLLHAGQSTFFSLGGFDPTWWDYGVATTLMAETLRARIASGDVIANLSATPDRPKLRWSRELRMHQDFALVREDRRSRFAFGAFWIARAMMQSRSARMTRP